jgi:predicted aldo/keto reductase-like oxidoreductase
MKKKGVIKHLGFSFHGTLDCLREIVAHHQWDFCQLQVNYYDWLYADTKKEYEIVAEAGLPVVVMESLRGGLLASLTPEAEALLKAAHPDWTIASWALRWLQRLPNVKVMLSGMSALNQIVDNVATCSADSALTDADEAILLEACERFRSSVLVPCTGCRYCVETCPAQINIPEVLKVYNDHKDIPWTFMGLMRTRSQGKPMDCVGCGLCTEHCPQNIDVPRYMAALTEKLMPNHKK